MAKNKIIERCVRQVVKDYPRVYLPNKAIEVLGLVDDKSTNVVVTVYEDKVVITNDKKRNVL